MLGFPKTKGKKTKK